jgi:hypothetical protein
LTFRVEKVNHRILNSFLIFLNYVKNVDYDEKLLEEIQKRVWQT